MTNARAPKRYRPGCAAALEYGVSPLARADYSPMRPEELHTVLPPRPDRSAHSRQVRQAAERIKAFRPARHVKGLVVTADDIRHHRGIV